MDTFNYNLHSGGADGSDTFWELIGKSYGLLSNVFHYFYMKETPRGNTQITEEEFEDGIRHVYKANNTLQRNISNNYTMYLLARNWIQVRNSDIVVAIGEFTSSRTAVVSGGTGWEVQMAIDSHKPVFFFNQLDCHWYKFNHNIQYWSMILDAPNLPPNFAGIGTRQITPDGIKAIISCYEATTNELNKSLFN